jgi:tetratricopeptide (TPR) repeat protein
MKNGMLYKKMGDYNAAIRYLNYAINDYNQYGFVVCIPRALYETGECHLKLKQYPEARERFLVVVQNFSDNEYAEKAAKRLSEIKKKVLASRDTTTVIKSFNRIY